MSFLIKFSDEAGGMPAGARLRFDSFLLAENW